MTGKLKFFGFNYNGVFPIVKICDLEFKKKKKKSFPGFPIFPQYYMQTFFPPILHILLCL